MTSLISAAQTCPLCQQANACAIAQGLDINRCWCAQQTLDKPSVIKQLDTANLMLDLPDNQCICQSCMTKLMQKNTLDGVEKYTP